MKKRKKSLLIIIVAIAVCVAAYIIVFHVPRPVMWNWETIEDYEETISIVKEDGTEEILHCEMGAIPVKDNKGSVIATIDKECLEAILKNTKALKAIINPPYYQDDVRYEISIASIKSGKPSPIHIRAGEEVSFCYRDGSGLLKYSIIDRTAFLQRLTGAMQTLPEKMK